MSHMSIVGGPPPIHSRMHALWFRLSAAAFARSECPSASATPASAEAPATCSIKCRRVMPRGVRMREHGPSIDELASTMRVASTSFEPRPICSDSSNRARDSQLLNAPK